MGVGKVTHGRGSGLTVTRVELPDGMWGSVDVHVAAHQLPMSKSLQKMLNLE